MEDLISLYDEEQPPTEDLISFSDDYQKATSMQCQKAISKLVPPLIPLPVTQSEPTQGPETGPPTLLLIPLPETSSEPIQEPEICPLHRAANKIESQPVQNPEIYPPHRIDNKTEPQPPEFLSDSARYDNLPHGTRKITTPQDGSPNADPFLWEKSLPWGLMPPETHSAL